MQTGHYFTLESRRLISRFPGFSKEKDALLIIFNVSQKITATVTSMEGLSKVSGRCSSGILGV
jgi:hypothetical protein